MAPIIVSLPDTKFHEKSFCLSRIIIRGDTDRHDDALNCISATFHRKHAQRQHLADRKLYLAVAYLTQQVCHDSFPSEDCSEPCNSSLLLKILDTDNQPDVQT